MAEAHALGARDSRIHWHVSWVSCGRYQFPFFLLFLLFILKHAVALVSEVSEVSDILLCPFLPRYTLLFPSEARSGGGEERKGAQCWITDFTDFTDRL
jgi:hypothetical protein